MIGSLNVNRIVLDGKLVYPLKLNVFITSWNAVLLIQIPTDIARRIENIYVNLVE